MIYSAIFNLNTIIADYSEDQGDFPTILTKVLKANRQPLEFYVVPYLNYEFFFLHKSDYTFACIVECNKDNEKILVFLQTLQESFLSMCMTEKENLTYKTTSLIRDLMSEHSSALDEDKFEKIEKKIDSIKKEKIQIIEQTIEKDMLLNKISAKSENLKKASLEMKFQVKRKLDNVKRSNLKYYCTVLFILLVFVLYMYYHFFYSQLNKAKVIEIPIAKTVKGLVRGTSTNV